MAFSAPRLTIYALLSSVEEDLRGLILEFVATGKSSEELLGKDLVGSAVRRYEDENGPRATSVQPAELLPYVDIGDLLEVLNRFRSAMPQHIAVHLRALNPQLKLLLPIRKRIAHIRPFRYDDFARVSQFTDQVSAEHPSHWPSVTETVAKLSRDPAFIFDLPQPRYVEPPNSAYHNLPLPEFDDTGFLGREAEVATVMSLCRGAWPVVSLVGEGGLGKTALALRCAYDLLDDPGRPFDAVIWSTSKTTRLDPTQIREIDGAIRDSLGLLEHVAAELGTPGSEEEVLKDILEFLESFRVLVILDNLETVLDDRIRAFLGRLPSGSKILITSRIGIGEFEYRVNVQPLPNVDASRLLRAVAKVSGVRQLATMDESRLAGLCERMQNNPLFIKWFVSAVQSGVAPEEALADPALFLEFCMSNVYDHLTRPAQTLLKALLASPDELSLPELVYFNGGYAHETQAAIQGLLTTNMLSMNSVGSDRGGIVETRYRLTELARLYLTRHHPLTPDEDRDLERARLKLHDDARRISHQIAGDPYEDRSIAVRARSDLLVVRPLLDALRFADGSDFSNALDCVLRAKDLAPNYYECFRIEGQVHGAARNVAVADAAFRTALGLAEGSAPLHFFYARFLRGVRHDVDSAVTQLTRALELDPAHPMLQLELARCNLEVLEFAAARFYIDDLLAGARTMAPPLLQEVWRLDLEYWVVRANFAVQTKAHGDAAGSLEAIRRAVDSAPPSVLGTLRAGLAKAVGAAWCCINESAEAGVRARGEEFLRWLRSQKGFRLPYTVPLSDDTDFGAIKFVDLVKQFGFIDTADHGEIYFNRSAMTTVSDFSLLKNGTAVEYRLAASERGRKAIDVALA